ncbi:MAG: hypothetical protein AAF267_22960 [Deinococcota bacterium]
MERLRKPRDQLAFFDQVDDLRSRRRGLRLRVVKPVRRLSNVVVLALLLTACSTNTATPTASCEQRFNAALERGVAYTEALGELTECLRLRGDTVNLSARNR